VPTYEYVCRDCGHRFEIVQSMWDDPLTMCPECGGSLRKVFAPPAISFKGSGFYTTDHGKKAKKPSEKVGSKHGAASPQRGLRDRDVQHPVQVLTASLERDGWLDAELDEQVAGRRPRSAPTRAGSRGS
jgi:putative FmdB family regulatory protein